MCCSNEVTVTVTVRLLCGDEHRLVLAVVLAARSRGRSEGELDSVVHEIDIGTYEKERDGGGGIATPNPLAQAKRGASGGADKRARATEFTS